jgi:hypothetical protein
MKRHSHVSSSRRRRLLLKHGDKTAAVFFCVCFCNAEDVKIGGLGCTWGAASASAVGFDGGNMAKAVVLVSGAPELVYDALRL